MHPTVTVTRSGRWRLWAAGLLAAAVAAFAAASAPPAHAAFDMTPCTGSSIIGEGSSLQKSAQQNFWTPQVFDTSFGCGSSAPGVTYNADGSGCGIAAMGGGGTVSGCQSAGNTGAPGYRDPATRFAGSDAPMTTAQLSNANAAGTAHPGAVHTLPVASAAVAIVVHPPDGCELTDPGSGTAANGAGSTNGNTTTGGVNDPTGLPTGDKASNHTLRVHINATELEKIWDGTASTWGDIWAGSITGAPTSSQAPTGATCANYPVRRLVRRDGSGTTYNFKAFLSLEPGAPSGLWTSAPVVGDNNVWPVTTSSNTTPPDVVTAAGPTQNQCTDAGNICKAAANGGGSLASAVSATDGSIGYLDLATARQKAFDVTAYTGSNTPGDAADPTYDHTYWLPVEPVNPSAGNSVANGRFIEPTADKTAHLNGGSGAPGANCTGADVRGLPVTPASDPTLGDWSNAIATGSQDTNTYPVCALTYDFAWDDDAPVYGNTASEEAQARTVKDYLTSVVSSAGQFGLTNQDYGTLPAGIVQMAEHGVAAIDWNKSASSGGGGGGGGGGTGGGGGGSTTPTTTPMTTPTTSLPPSNDFTITGTSVRSKLIVLTLNLPGPGLLGVTITSVGNGNFTVANLLTQNVGGGPGTLTLTPSSRALKLLAKKHKLLVAVKVTYTPAGSGATPNTKSARVTLVQKAKAATKHKKKKKKKSTRH